MSEVFIAVAAIALFAIVALLFVALMRLRALAGDRESQSREGAELRARVEALIQGGAERERDMRADLSLARREQGDAATALRREIGERLAQFQEGIQRELVGLTHAQRDQLKLFGDQLAHGASAQAEQGKTIADRVTELAQSNEQRLEAVRTVVQQRLDVLRSENAAKLEEMRATVDEKLQKTLEQRLSDSFKMVSERLELVHRGLGEMQTLATGVGDLKRVLTNVKTRGTWGEVQLGALLADMLTPAQYAKNIATRPGSRERVEYAVRFPGRGEDNQPCWLPIDAKFPLADWQRLQDAVERADAAAVEGSRKSLEQFFKLQAKDIRDKYIESPHTTDFAILFIPTEGLFAEAVSRPGLADTLQREYRVTLAGPTTLAAILNSLQLGFRTLAIEQRSTQVWRVLGEVKTEFGRFGDILARTKDKLDQVGKTLDEAGRKSTTIARKLRDVEAVPIVEPDSLLAGPIGSSIDTLTDRETLPLLAADALNDTVELPDEK